MVVGPLGNCPVCLCAKTALMSNMPHRYHEIKARIFALIFYCHWEIWTRNYQPLITMVKTKSNNSQTSGKWNELIQLVSKPPPPYNWHFPNSNRKQYKNRSSYLKHVCNYIHNPYMNIYIQTSWSISSINERKFTHEIQTIHICTRELKIFQNC